MWILGVKTIDVNRFEDLHIFKIMFENGSASSGGLTTIGQKLINLTIFIR